MVPIAPRIELVSLSEIDGPTSGRVFFHEIASYHVWEDDFAVTGINTNHLLGLGRTEEEPVVHWILSLKAAFWLLISFEPYGRRDVCTTR
jgi:hypothetical protein